MSVSQCRQLQAPGSISTSRTCARSAWCLQLTVLFEHHLLSEHHPLSSSSPLCHSSPLCCECSGLRFYTQVRPHRICPASALHPGFGICPPHRLQRLPSSPSTTPSIKVRPCCQTIPLYVYNTFLYPLIISIFRNCKTFYSWDKYF